MNIRFIGDVHGKFSRYKKIIGGCNRSIQLGDFGVGFKNPRTDTYCNNPPYDAMKKGEHKFIRGNHDNPEVCLKHPFWIKDGSYPFDNPKIFCIGGALSIDKHLRTEGYDWWPKEELSYGELCSLMDIYEQVKPSIIVTHECPESTISRVCLGKGIHKFDIPSVTRRCFDNMLEIHKPDIWIHGHWHIDYHMIFNGVEFIGLGELSHLDLEI